MLADLFSTLVEVIKYVEILFWNYFEQLRVLFASPDCVVCVASGDKQFQRIAKGAGGKGPRQKTSKIVKKCQKAFRHFSTFFAQGKKNVKNRRKVSKIFSTLFFDNFRAAHQFSGPFWGALTVAPENTSGINLRNEGQIQQLIRVCTVATKIFTSIKKCFWIFLIYITLNITLKMFFGNWFLNVIVFCLQFVWREDELHYIKKLARELNLITLHLKIH